MHSAGILASERALVRQEMRVGMIVCNRIASVLGYDVFVNAVLMPAMDRDFAHDLQRRR